MNQDTPSSLDPEMQRRAEAMYSRDQWSALLILAVLWATLIYTYIVVPHGFLSTPIGIVLIISGALLLLFNTSSVLAMPAHYREYSDHMWSILGVVSYQRTTSAHSFIGRQAGRFSIHAITVMDAYIWARFRYARWQKASAPYAT